MKFSVAERMALLGMLPAEGDIVTLRILRDLKAALSFSEDEIARGKITAQPNGWVIWDQSVQLEKEIEIGPAAFGVIRTALKNANDAKKLKEASIGLYERFVEQS